MTDIEKKALALVNEVPAEWGVLKNAVEVPKNSDAFARALCRAIEQHEAFRQEVSRAVDAYQRSDGVTARNNSWERLCRFIIAKPDPLAEILLEEYGHVSADADAFRAALAKRGLEIKEITK